MLYKYFTEKLIGLQDLEVEKIENFNKFTQIHCRLKRKIHKCPSCGQETDKIHDYRK